MSTTGSGPSKHPYHLPETPYCKLYEKFLTAKAMDIFQQSGRLIALAFHMKYSKWTHDARYHKPIPFGFRDAKKVGVSSPRTFDAAMDAGEGIFWRRVEKGGGRAMAKYEPLRKWLTYMPTCRLQRSTPTGAKSARVKDSNSAPLEVQTLHGSSASNKALNEELLVKDVYEEISIETQAFDFASMPDTEEELAEWILWQTDPEYPPRDRYEFGILLKAIHNKGVEAVQKVVKETLPKRLKEENFYPLLYYTLGYR